MPPRVSDRDAGRYRAMRERHGGRFWWVSLFTVFLLQAMAVVLAATLVAGAPARASPLRAGLPPGPPDVQHGNSREAHQPGDVAHPCRKHQQQPREEAEKDLMEYVNDIVERGGTAFIPSFSVERAQERIRKAGLPGVLADRLAAGA